MVLITLSLFIQRIALTTFSATQPWKEESKDQVWGNKMFHNLNATGILYGDAVLEQVTE